MSALAKSPNTLTIELYRHDYMDEIGQLITSIQQKEFNVPITYEDQPDLRNIPSVYQKGCGNFWMALDGNQLIGTIALIDAGESTGVIRKMFVRKEYRGSGIAQQLLDRLIAYARAYHVQHLYLGTVDKLQAALRFYEKNGFALLDNDNLPPVLERIRMKQDNKHYARSL